MPTFEDMKNKYKGSHSIGQQLKVMSDMVMQETFDNDISTRECYIYDYNHDDQKDILGGKKYHPELSKTKKKVKLKFIIKEYKSASKDDPEAHIMFKPDDWNNDIIEPDWFEDGYGKFGINFPVGLFVDIPDDKGLYWKWLIFYDEVANQFPKFGVLRCNYYFQWIESTDTKRIKRSMCGVERTQNSYTSGKWSGDKITTLDNQDKFWLPWNPISAEIQHDIRFIISMLQKKPYVYQVSKIMNTSPKGIVEITLTQGEFNQFTDYVNIETGEMYADYYKSNIDPNDTTIITPDDLIHNINKEKIIIFASSSEIGLEISKRITATVVDADNNKIEYNNAFVWNISSDDIKDCSSFGIEYNGNYNEELKLTIPDNDDYVGSVITITCAYNDIVDTIDLEICY